MGAELPELNRINVTRQVVTGFGGLNHNPLIADNEFYDMQNMGSDYYPLLSPREQMAGLRYIPNCKGMICYGGLLYWIEQPHDVTDHDDLYCNGRKIGTLESTIDGHLWVERQMVGMGNHVYIWPDKVYIDGGKIKSLENTVVIDKSQYATTISPCKIDGTMYAVDVVSDTAPENPTDGMYWMDTSQDGGKLKQFSEAYGMWQGVATTYVRIGAVGINEGFSQYDAVTISNVAHSELNGSRVIQTVGENFIVVIGLVAEQYTENFDLTVKREVPNLEYVCENENRLWGCSSENHEIYACVLGDPKNWNRYLGISTDSYGATIGSPEDFTGCIGYQGGALFFKEHEIIRIYGNKPANFQIITIKDRGVARGAAKTLAYVGETLYYKHTDGICAYNGASPVLISDKLGSLQRQRATVAGVFKNKYYIDLADGVVVYDTGRGLWHREAREGESLGFFARSTQGDNYDPGSEELYRYNGIQGILYTIGGRHDSVRNQQLAQSPYAQPEGTFPWFAQTGDIGIELLENKYISKIQLRMEVDEGALVRIQLQYDNETDWEEKYKVNPTKKQVFTVPIIPRRCDIMRIRITGRGGARIYAIAKSIEQGSEL